MTNPNEKIADIFDKLLDDLMKSYRKAAKEYDSKSIPLKLIKMYHDTVKKGYRKGMKPNRQQRRAKK